MRSYSTLRRRIGAGAESLSSASAAGKPVARGSGAQSGRRGSEDSDDSVDVLDDAADIDEVAEAEARSRANAQRAAAAKTASRARNGGAAEEEGVFEFAADEEPISLTLEDDADDAAQSWDRISSAQPIGGESPAGPLTAVADRPHTAGRPVAGGGEGEAAGGATVAVSRARSRKGQRGAAAGQPASSLARYAVADSASPSATAAFPSAEPSLAPPAAVPPAPAGVSAGAAQPAAPTPTGSGQAGSRAPLGVRQQQPAPEAGNSGVQPSGEPSRPSKAAHDQQHGAAVPARRRRLSATRFGQSAHRLLSNRYHKRDELEAAARLATCNSKEPASPELVLFLAQACQGSREGRARVLTVARSRLLDSERPKHVLKALQLLLRLTDAEAAAGAAAGGAGAQLPPLGLLAELQQDKAALEQLGSGSAAQPGAERGEGGTGGKHLPAIRELAKALSSRLSLALEAGGAALAGAAGSRGHAPPAPTAAGAEASPAAAATRQSQPAVQRAPAGVAAAAELGAGALDSGEAARARAASTHAARAPTARRADAGSAAADEPAATVAAASVPLAACAAESLSSSVREVHGSMKVRRPQRSLVAHAFLLSRAGPARAPLLSRPRPVAHVRWPLCPRCVACAVVRAAAERRREHGRGRGGRRQPGCWRPRHCV